MGQWQEPEQQQRRYWFCNPQIIAWTTAVSHTTAVRYSSYHLRCMLEWSQSGHCCICINHSAHNFKWWLKKTPNRRHLQLYWYLPTNSIPVLNLHGFLCRFWLCPSNNILKINEQYKQRLTHKTGQLYPTAAKQIVPKIFLDPHLTKCR